MNNFKIDAGKLQTLSRLLNKIALITEKKWAV